MDRIYLDFNASTPIDPEVAEAMRPFLTGGYGNPSSLHWAGIPARQAVEKARRQVAELLHCQPDEIVFTSGGTEASNHAIKGVFFRAVLRQDPGATAETETLPGAPTGSRAPRPPSHLHFLTTAVEHPATLQPLRFLQSLGARVTVLPVDRHGRVDPEAVARAITPETVLVTIMHANNEVGTIEPIAEIGRITRERGVLFHTDAAQSAGKIPVDVTALGVDLLSIAGHKLHAPKGVGALFVRRGVVLEPLVHGAGHESGRRAGTENVLLIAGLGQACEIAGRWKGAAEVRRLRDFLEEELKARFGPRIVINGHPEHRLPNTLSVNFVGKIGADILSALESVAASTGSACHAGSVELSPVLKAMGVSPEVGMGAIRFSLGRTTTEDEVQEVLQRLSAILG